MKRIALLAAIGGGLLAVPSSAAAATDCTARGGGNAPQVNAYGTLVNGNPGPRNAWVGVCADTNTQADGGYAEVGERLCYVIVDGSNNNPGQLAGYAGLFGTCVTGGSPVTDSGKDTNCDGNDTGSAPNTGGCFWLRTGLGAPVDGDHTNAVTTMFVCGNTSGADWSDDATRDGCSVP